MHWVYNVLGTCYRQKYRLDKLNNNQKLHVFDNNNINYSSTNCALYIGCNCFADIPLRFGINQKHNKGETE